MNSHSESRCNSDLFEEHKLWLSSTNAVCTEWWTRVWACGQHSIEGWGRNRLDLQFASVDGKRMGRIPVSAANGMRQLNGQDQWGSFQPTRYTFDLLIQFLCSLLEHFEILASWLVFASRSPVRLSGRWVIINIKTYFVFGVIFWG